MMTESQINQKVTSKAIGEEVGGIIKWAVAKNSADQSGRVHLDGYGLVDLKIVLEMADLLINERLSNEAFLFWLKSMAKHPSDPLCIKLDHFGKKGPTLVAIDNAERLYFNDCSTGAQSRIELLPVAPLLNQPPPSFYAFSSENRNKTSNKASGCLGSLFVLASSVIMCIAILIKIFSSV